MKTFTYTIELSDEAILNTFNWLVSRGNVASDAVPDEAVYNYAKSLQSVMYNDIATQVIDYVTMQSITKPEITPKEIGGGIN